MLFEKYQSIRFDLWVPIVWLSPFFANAAGHANSESANRSILESVRPKEITQVAESKGWKTEDFARGPSETGA